ncbi:TadE/TadG family type IV pilus assembly protein [Streptomyces sp. KLOTTS4A1]|uniref:TadE/TadG family type IV pilus assembly protein n=1 Tax=Streptomyces sp. KLOTTS4A1 TaxID=3390996 RepID=UPI0039F44E35
MSRQKLLSNPAPGPRALKSDRGAVILEFTGFLPTLLLVGLACIQLGLVGYSASQAGTGARAAARAASLDESAQTAGRRAMSGWLTSDVTRTEGDGTVTAQVTVHIPDLVPFADMGWTATREVTMPVSADD